MKLLNTLIQEFIGRKNLFLYPALRESIWNKGKRGIYSLETRKKMGLAFKGKHHSKESKEKISQKLKSLHCQNKLFSPEHKRKISLALQGRIAWNKGLKGIYFRSEEVKRKMSEAQKKVSHHYWLGKKRPDISLRMKKRIISAETRQKISKTLIGHKPSLLTIETAKTRFIGKFNPNWKGGITPINKVVRGLAEYRLWRKSVFERDNYTCIWCGERGGRLNADHIKSFAYYPELRFEVSNGRTLCESCHRETQNFGRKNVKEEIVYDYATQNSKGGIGK